MRRRRTNLSLYLVGTAVAVASWTVAGTAMADMVILNPAEMTGQVSFGAETLSQFIVEAHSSDGFESSGTFSTSPYLLTVESGHSYNPWIYGYFSNPTASQSYLQVIRNDAVLIDNTQGPTTVDFNYPNTSHINFSINVTGGTIRYYHMYASASEGTENYWSWTYNNFSSPQPSNTTSWNAMVPDSAVQVYGTAYLKAADGTDVTRNLTAQTLDLSQGSVSVNFPIDLTANGTLAGNIGLATGAAISSHTIYFRGVSGTSTAGVSGSKPVSTNGSYSIDLAPGDYDVYLRTNFTSPSRYSDTKSYRVTIPAGSTLTQDFIETLGNGQVPLTVSGFFSNDDLSWVQMYLRRQDPSPGIQTMAYHSKPTDGLCDYPLQSGDWKRYRLVFGLYDVSDPNLPLNEQYYRYHYTDSEVLPVTVSAGTTADLGSEDVTLVKSNAYFDVTEPEGQTEQILLSSPYIDATRYDYNGDNTQKAYKRILAYGSSEAKALSALTIAAEPGTYEMRAYATVNGSEVQFNSNPITFGEPAPTPAGTNVDVVPIATEDLVLNLSFPEVTTPGITTVVETPLGPPAPEGFSVACNEMAQQEGIDCTPMYYDIKTTAAYPTDATGDALSPIAVCVRRKFAGANALDAFLQLGHYNETTGAWEVLEPPPGMMPATDCAADLAACGCADEASCGIDYNADPPVSVIMVCGMTTSFSPFAILKGQIKFTNEVNGQDYEGPTGPPSLQTWTVPENGNYHITANGASGAAALSAMAQGRSGGCGAEIAGDFALQAGDTLQILVGQKGTAAQYSGGGGGGTFVTLNGTPLVIAGGGGGLRYGAQVNGMDASLDPNGVSGSLSYTYSSGFIAGGTNGMGGSRASSYGSGGGGWLGDGASDGNFGEGGFSFLNGGKGGAGKACGAPAHGGYGGGGAGNGCYGGGGGGGYSGGGGGRVAGGGGSWNAGANPQAKVQCTPSGHGRVTIGYLGQ